MRETLLLDVPHRQVVFTIPKRLRVFFKFDRRLLGDLCRSALRSLSHYFEIVTGSALTPGIIAALQTFGNRINLHVHLHFLVTEGGVDEGGVFHKIPGIDDSRLAEIFGGEVRMGIQADSACFPALNRKRNFFSLLSLYPFIPPTQAPPMP